MKNLVFCSVIILSQVLAAVEIKEIVISGTGCEKQTLRNVKPSRGDDFQVPFIFSLMKHDSSQLERKACMLAFPVDLGKKEKLQVSNLSQNVTLKAFGGAQLKLSLDMTAVGLKAMKPLEIEIKNPTALDQDLKFDGVLFETKCGGNVMVRANVNAFVQGPGTASATTGDLMFTLKKVPCK